MTKKDNNCVMSMLYSRQISGEPRFVGFESDSNKLIMYQGVKEGPISTIEKSMFTKGITIRGDLAPCGITFCTPDIVTQFTDNFDFEQFDQVIREYLVNDEILGQSIKIEILPEDVVAFTAADYGSLLRAQRLLIHRWCYPLTYDRLPARVFDNLIPLRYHRKHVYVPRNEEEPSNAQGTVLGRNCKVSNTSELLDVTLGNDCFIDSNVRMESVIAGHNLRVGKNVSIDGAVIGDNVTICDNVKIKSKTVIGDNVTIREGSTIASNSAVMSGPPENDDDIRSRNENGYFLWKLKDERSGHFWKRTHSFSRARRERHASEMSRTSLQASISVEEATTPTEEQTTNAKADVILNSDVFFKVFVNEVQDSMLGTYDSSQRAEDEKITSLIVDINSSRFANNMTPDDVAKGVFAAFLGLPPIKQKDLPGLEELFTDWITLWYKYYKTDSNKMHCLLALEEAANVNTTVMAYLPKIIMLLYNELDDIDFEPTIMKWYEGLTDGSSIKNRAKLAIDALLESDSDDEESEEDA